MNTRKTQEPFLAPTPTRVWVEIDVDLRDTLVWILLYGAVVGPAGPFTDDQRIRLIEQLGG